MKTNFLYFRELGFQSYIATSGQTAFVIDDGGASALNFDEDFSDHSTGLDLVETDIIVTVDGSVIATGDRSFAGNTVTLATGATTGDVVTIALTPQKGTEAMFSADRFLGVETDASGTSSVISFKAMTSNTAGPGDDTITLTYPSETNMVTSKAIATAIDAALNSNDNGGIINMLDRPNGSGLLSGLGITRSVISLV
tara:strand:+ start:742 stop:1332 length:591 start_codon:yes stop_codon:yes gene_type:complete